MCKEEKENTYSFNPVHQSLNSKELPSHVGDQAGRGSGRGNRST